MPGPNTYAFGNLLNSWVLSITLSPASVAANTSAEQTFTIAGLLTTDQVSAVNKPTVQAGLIVASGRITAANTIGITFANVTASPIVPTASEIYKVEINRPDLAEVMTSIV